MKFGISLLFILVGWNLFAKVTLKDVNSLGIVHYQQAELSEDMFTILVSATKGSQSIQLFAEDKLIFEKKVSPVTDGFRLVRFKTFEQSEIPFAIIVSNKGVHGQQISVISLKDGKEVWHETSAWPLEFELTKKSVEVKLTDEDQKAQAKSWAP